MHRADTASNELPDRTDWGSASAMGTPELADYPVTLVTRALYAVPRDHQPAAGAAAPGPGRAEAGRARELERGQRRGVRAEQASAFGDFSGLAGPISPLGGDLPGDGGDIGWGRGFGAATADYTARDGDDGGVEGARRRSSRRVRRGVPGASPAAPVEGPATDG